MSAVQDSRFMPAASWAWFVLPAVLLVITVAVLAIWRPFDRLAATAPPVENATVESVRLSDGLISLALRTDGSEPVRIAQVQVDGGYRSFNLSPEQSSARLATTRVDIPYPWIDGEAHHIALITSTGAVIEHSIDVAQTTPVLNANSLWMLAAVGLLLGAVPVAIGLLTYPAIRSVSPSGITFLLALTVGLLTFLLIDTIGEGLESAEKTIDRLRGIPLFWSVFVLTAIVLVVLGRSGGRPPDGLRLAGFIALGIGLHNLGEGLAVGAALATGSAALATYLVIGFTIHNVTEGIGIAAPLAHERPTLWHFAGLALLAGAPAVLGTIIGTQAVSPLWIAVCFGIGAGAILQVMIEVTGLMIRRGGWSRVFGSAAVSGLAVGLIVMYGTALLV